MDYTTLENAKSILDAVGTSDDALLKRMITEASRAIDRHCAGFVNSSNYFMLQTIVDECKMGILDKDGNILAHIRKPVVASVADAAYRYSPISQWMNVPVSQISYEGYAVKLWTGIQNLRGRIEVKISYIGGYAIKSSALPEDVVNAADLLAVRFYRESKTGLTDSIGIAELGTMQYTKAMPVRLVEMLKPWKRKIA